MIAHSAFCFQLTRRCILLLLLLGGLLLLLLGGVNKRSWLDLELTLRDDKLSQLMTPGTSSNLLCSFWSGLSRLRGDSRVRFIHDDWIFIASRYSVTVRACLKSIIGSSDRLGRVGFVLTGSLVLTGSDCKWSVLHSLVHRAVYGVSEDYYIAWRSPGWDVTMVAELEPQRRLR